MREREIISRFLVYKTGKIKWHSLREHYKYSKSVGVGEVISRHL